MPLGLTRAGAIVVLPGIGTMKLMANEIVYDRPAGPAVRRERDDRGDGVLSSLGATFAGQTLAALLPFPPMQLAVSVSVTYAVGKHFRLD